MHCCSFVEMNNNLMLDDVLAGADRPVVRSTNWRRQMRALEETPAADFGGRSAPAGEASPLPAIS